MIGRIALAVLTFLSLPVLAACSEPDVKPLLEDPSQWPLARLTGFADRPEQLPDEAERALARIKVGSHDLIAWIHPSGLCGLAGSDWSMNIDLTKAEGQTTRENGFSGPLESAAATSMQSEVSLFCTPTRMLIRVDGQTSKPFVSGDAAAQVVNGGLNAVVGSEAALQESLPAANITKGG
ncbi:hypothetical protein [Herbidospora sp. RD11066]